MTGEKYLIAKPAARPRDPRRPYECSWNDPPCTANFQTLHILQRHTAETHERRYERQCSSCGCWLNNKQSLQHHEGSEKCKEQQVLRAERQRIGADDPPGFRRRLYRGPATRRARKIDSRVERGDGMAASPGGTQTQLTSNKHITQQQQSLSNKKSRRQTPATSRDSQAPFRSYDEDRFDRVPIYDGQIRIGFELVPKGPSTESQAYNSSNSSHQVHPVPLSGDHRVQRQQNGYTALPADFQSCHQLQQHAHSSPPRNIPACQSASDCMLHYPNTCPPTCSSHVGFHSGFNSLAVDPTHPSSNFGLRHPNNVFSHEYLGENPIDSRLLDPALFTSNVPVDNPSSDAC